MIDIPSPVHFVQPGTYMLSLVQLKAVRELCNIYVYVTFEKIVIVYSNLYSVRLLDILNRTKKIITRNLKKK